MQRECAHNSLLKHNRCTNSQPKVNRYCILLILLFGGFWPAGAQKFPFFEPIRPSRAFQVMAHRGASGQAPENTRLALQRAIEDGFEWAEVDLQLTRDGKHVLYHDGKLDGKTDGAGRVADYSLADLKKLDAGSWFAPRYAGERLLSLQEAFEIAREVLRRIPMRPIRISHHRGANRYAPENTLPAFEKSIRMGADFVEFDVRTTRDGQFFLLHDGDLSRTTNRAGPIRDLSADVVTGLDAGSWFGRPFAGVRPPT